MKIWKIFVAMFMMASVAVAANYHTAEQQKTIGSLYRMDKNGYLFEVTYHGDYKFDEVLAEEPLTAEAVQEVIRKKLLPQSNMKYKPLPSSFACTAIAAVNPENNPLLGHNYDMTKDERATLMVHTAAPGKYASVGVADMGWLGMQKDEFVSSVAGQEALIYAPFYVMDGVNEKGFSIATLWIPGYHLSGSNGMKKIYSGLIPRYMLDNARSVQDALEQFEKLDVKMAFEEKKCAYHWLLNDAYGDCAVVEFVNGKFSVQPKAFTAKHQVATNYWLTPEIKVKGENGFARVKTLEKNFKKIKYPTDQQVMDWLQSVVPQNDKELQKLENLTLTTNWTVVYNLTKCTGSICLRENYDKKYNFAVR